MALTRPDREAGAPARLVAGVALGAALLLGAGMYLWNRRGGEEPPGAVALSRNGDAEFDSYLPMLALDVEKLSVARNFAGSRMVLVAARIHNGGDRWVEALEVEATLRNGRQEVLRQPRLVLKPGSGVRPVGPGEGDSFSARLEQLPPEWMGDGADVQISGLRLAPPR